MADDRGTEPLNHGDQDMIVRDAQCGVVENLDRGVSVADVPGDAGAVGRAVAGDVGDGLGRGSDADVGAILKDKSVAVGQAFGVGEVEQEWLAGVVGQADTAAVTVVEGQGNGGDWVARQVTGPNHGCRTA